MRRNKAIGLIFLATSSVYSVNAAGADRAGSATGAAPAALTSDTATVAPAAPGTGGLYFSKGSVGDAATVAPVVNDAASRVVAPPTAAAAPHTDAAAPATAVPALGTATAAPATDAPIPVDPTGTTGNNTVAAADPFSQAPAGPAANTGRSVTSDDVDFNNNAGTVEIHVNDANLVEVLRMLSLQSQKNIIASKDVHGTVTANLYGVTVREALDAILTSNGYTFREEGNFIYVYTAQELEAQRQAQRVRKTQVFRCYYTPVATAVNMIKPVLSKEGEVAFTDPAHVGLDTGTGDAGGNTHATEDVMVVTDYEDRLAEVQRVLAEVDKRPQQVLIEATILRATLSEDNALGVDFQVLGGVDFSGLNAANTTFSAAAGGGIQNTATANNVVNKGFAAGGTGFTNNVPTGGLQVGVVKNNIAMFLEALETVTDTTVLANPKILALNKQKGEVIVGREDGYVTSTTTNTATVQTVEFLQTGTRLIFRPFIGDDGYVRMEIHPEDSSGGLGQGNLPFKVTTEVTSNVMVRDGHTVVIGGLFREDSNSTRGQVPGLGNIPFAGALFRSQRDMTTREEIIILLTPHIVKDEAAYAAASEVEMQRLDQLRVGVRRGMMPLGRERLAEGFYDAATAELNKPNPDRGRALWDLNAAMNLNPKFVEANELREQLTQRKITSVDNSISRDFVRRQALSDLATQRFAPHRIAVPPMRPGTTTMPTTAPTTLPTQLKQTPDRPDTTVVTDMPTTMPTTAPSSETTAAAVTPTTQPTVVQLDDGGVETIWPTRPQNENETAAATDVATNLDLAAVLASKPTTMPATTMPTTAPAAATASSIDDWTAWLH